MKRWTAIAIPACALSLVVGCDRLPSASDSAAGGAPAAVAPSLTGGNELTATSDPHSQRGGGPLDRPVVFVVSQGLYFDSIVTADPLPMRGPFQKLEMGSNGLQTDFGPGDRGYLGGRWWMDTTAPFGEMNPGDHFFLCPLLGPGRESP